MEEFSMPLFLVTVILTLSCIAMTMICFFPDLWRREIQSGFRINLAVFLLVHFGNAFAEFFFHRYVLHKPVIGILKRFYKQHTLHHGLTRVVIVNRLGEKQILNKYPITEEKQKEASFFPWYSLLVFSILATPFFAMVSILIPWCPIFIPGYLAIAFSLVLYELVHAVEHLPYDTFWSLKVETGSALSRALWRNLYTFHLRHHADILSNEGISGFFCIPVADFVFGTYLPSSLYIDESIVDVESQKGELSDPRATCMSDFASPVPRSPIKFLDKVVGL